jgi:regulatory protein
VHQRSSESRPAKPGDAVATGLRLLGRRDHSREELRRKLDRRGHDQQAIEEAMRRIHESYGGLNDPAFARSYVRRRADARGPMAIAAELAARGIDRKVTEAALAEFGPEAQLRSATRIAERLYDSQKPGMGYREMRDKIGAKLLRRGFPTTIVRAACQSVIERPED